MRIAVITASDRCSRGEAEDQSGPAIVAFCRDQGWEVTRQLVLPDDLQAISKAIEECADMLQVDLVLTTGGTGLGPRDTTPEATLASAHRLVPGIAEALRAESLKLTPFAMLSRGAAAMRGKTLIINLPGSPKAVRECLEVLRPVLPHAIETAGGAGHPGNLS